MLWRRVSKRERSIDIVYVAEAPSPGLRAILTLVSGG